MAAFPAGPWRIRGEKALASPKGGKAAVGAAEKDHGGNSMAQPEEDACHSSEWPEQLLKKRQPVGKREKNHESPDREDPCFLVERHPSPKKCPHAAPLACCLARHLGLWHHLAACMPLGFARHATVRRGLLHVRAHPRGGPAAKNFGPEKGRNQHRYLERRQEPRVARLLLPHIITAQPAPRSAWRWGASPWRSARCRDDSSRRYPPACPGPRPARPRSWLRSRTRSWPGL